MKKIFGYFILSLPIVSLIIFSLIKQGLLISLFTFGLVVLIISLTWFGVYLIKSK